MHFGSVQRSANVATMFSPDKDLVSLEQWAIDLDYRQGEKGLKVVQKALNGVILFSVQDVPLSYPRKP